MLNIVPVKITNSAEAMVENPLDVALAPHFSRVVYTLTEPTYSTSCDDRGDFKALVGTPTISVDDSRVLVTPVSSMKTSVVLSRTDAPEINRTHAFYELCFDVTNALSWTNISLYDLSGDWINISVHSGISYYDYDSGTRQLGIFYSPVAAGTDYVIAFDLTISSVTLFLYGTNGTLLADKYISNNLLVGGDLDEIRFELQGSSSNTLAVDYLYMLGAGTLPGDITDCPSLDPLQPDDIDEEPRIDLDPTSLTMDQSLRQELFGFGDVQLDRTMTETELLEAIGQTDIHEQRASGRLVAQGYKDVRGSIEDGLVSYIAENEGVDVEEVFLIDYYIDYLQCKLEVANKVVDKLADEFRSKIAPMEEVLGGTVEKAGTSASALSETVTAMNISLGSVANQYLNWPTIMAENMRGLVQDPLGLGDAADDIQKILEDIYKDAQDRADLTLNQTTQLMRDWQQSTDEKYQQVRQDYLNFISIAQAQTAQLASDYSEMQDKFERTISKFFSYTQNQFEATNAIIAKLLLQNEDFAEASRQTNQYFAGQLTKSNEVLMNLTSSITSSLTAGDFWKGVFDNGKASSEPLTFSSFFGNNMKEIITFIVIGFMITAIALILISVFRRKSGGARTARH